MPKGTDRRREPFRWSSIFRIKATSFVRLDARPLFSPRLKISPRRVWLRFFHLFASPLLRIKVTTPTHSKHFLQSGKLRETCPPRAKEENNPRSSSSSSLMSFRFFFFFWEDKAEFSSGWVGAEQSMMSVGTRGDELLEVVFLLND